MWQSIKNPAWQWVFGMLAAEGLRPEEIFHLDCSELSTDPGWLKVLPQTKTSSRIILPLKADWRYRWQLWDIKMPNIATVDKNNTDLGRKITNGLHLQGIKITPYYLRDAYMLFALLFWELIPVSRQDGWDTVCKFIFPIITAILVRNPLKTHIIVLIKRLDFNK